MAVQHVSGSHGTGLVLTPPAALLPLLMPYLVLPANLPAVGVHIVRIIQLFSIIPLACSP